MRILVAALVAGVVAYQTRSTLIAVAVGLTLYLALSWRTLRPGVGRRWWTHRNLVQAMMDAGVLPPLKKDQKPWVIHYRGKPQTTEAGTTVIVELPRGIPHTVVAGKQAQLASALRVPLAKLIVSHEPTDPAGAVRLWVGNPDKPVQAKHARSHLATTKVTRWSDPVRIGQDSRGKVVELGTDEHNTIVSGIMGSGKTTMGRLLIGHYLLDPTTLIYGCDGKGSRKDYGRVAALAVLWVWGTDTDPAADTLSMFGELLAMVQDRNLNSETDATPAGVLVILEEYQDIRAAADKQTREQLDAALGRIVRMGRAVAFHILISTQRPSVDDFPSGQRNLIDQRIALMTRNGADASLVLGHTPTLTLPSRRGDAIVTLPDQDHAAAIDYLDDADWQKLCARATRQPATAEAEPEPSAAEPVGVVVASPLEQAVAAVLTDHPDGLSATQLLAALRGDTGRIPDTLAPANPTALGKALGQSRWVEKGKDSARGRLWRLNESGRRENPSFDVSGHVPGHVPDTS